MKLRLGFYERFTIKWISFCMIRHFYVLINVIRIFHVDKSKDFYFTLSANVMFPLKDNPSIENSVNIRYTSTLTMFIVGNKNKLRELAKIHS